MACLRILLVLLILIGNFGITIAKQPKQVVKNLGKRFADKTLGAYAAQWMHRPEEERRKFRQQNLDYIGELIQKQSSDENHNWDYGEWALQRMMSPDFQGTLCGGAKLNYVEFIDHWKKQRNTFRKNDHEKVYLNITSPDERTIAVRFMVSFAQYGWWDYTLKGVYIVDVKLKTEKGDKDMGVYIINSIEDVGQCPEYGKVDWKEANITETLRLKEDDPEEREKVEQFLKEVFHVGQVIDVVPIQWAQEVTAKYEFFSGHICHDGLLKRYGKVKMIKWWKKFQLLWHPVANSTNHTELQLLGGTRGRYVYKATMYLRLGPNPAAEIQKVELKMQIKYNVHGDQLWYVNDIEVMCPLLKTRKLMELHAGVIREVIGERMQKMVDNPAMWYTCTDVFYDLVSKDKVEFESCAGLEGQEMEKIDMLNQLEHKFWETNKDKNGRLEGYDLGGHRQVSEVGQDMWVEIFAIWTPLAENTVHESRWKFNIRWNKDMQIYEIVKISFGCPQTGKGNKWYSSLREYP